jgi:hypothetical protein
MLWARVIFPGDYSFHGREEMQSRQVCCRLRRCLTQRKVVQVVLSTCDLRAESFGSTKAYRLGSLLSITE